MKLTKIINRLKCELMYRRAVSMADKASSKDGQVYFVLPTETKKLMVINHAQYILFRKKGLTPKDAKPKDLFRSSVYHTNCRSDKAKRMKKRKFLSWLNPCFDGR